MRTDESLWTLNYCRIEPKYIQKDQHTTEPFFRCNFTEAKSVYSFTGQEALLSQKLNNACNKTLHLAFKSVKNRIVHHSRLFGWSIFGLKVCKVLSLIQSNLSVLAVKNTLSPLFSCSGFCSCSLVPVTSKSDR